MKDFTTLYISRTDIERNNRDIDALLKVLKKCFAPSYCFFTGQDMIVSKCHFNKNVSDIPAGMDVIIIEKDYIGDYLTLFNIRNNADIAFFSGEEIALIQSAKRFAPKSIEEFQSIDDYKNAEQRGDVVIEVLEPDEWTMPKGFEEEYKKAFDNKVSQLKSATNASADAIKESADMAAQLAVDTLIFKANTLEHPYLLRNLRSTNVSVLVTACQDADWIKGIVSKDASALVTLFNSGYVKFYGPTFNRIITKKFIMDAIARDYSVVRIFDSLPSIYDAARKNQSLKNLYERCAALTDDSIFISFVLEQKKAQGFNKNDNVFVLVRASERLREDKTLVAHAVRVDVNEFCYASDKLRRLKSFILDLLRQGYYGIIYGISQSLLKSDFKFECHQLCESMEGYDWLAFEQKFAGFDWPAHHHGLVDKEQVHPFVNGFGMEIERPTPYTIYFPGNK